MSRRRIEQMVNQMGSIVTEMQTLHFRYVQTGRSGWEPLMNVYRYPEYYEICVELSGVALDDISIGVQGRRITVAGIRRWPDLRCKETGSRCHRTTLMEIADGEFWREIELPEDVDSGSVEVRDQQGLVWIRLQLS